MQQKDAGSSSRDHPRWLPLNLPAPSSDAPRPRYLPAPSRLTMHAAPSVAASGNALNLLVRPPPSHDILRDTASHYARAAGLWLGRETGITPIVQQAGERIQAAETATVTRTPDPALQADTAGATGLNRALRAAGLGGLELSPSRYRQVAGATAGLQAGVQTAAKVGALGLTGAGGEPLAGSAGIAERLGLGRVLPEGVTAGQGALGTIGFGKAVQPAATRASRALNPNTAFNDEAQALDNAKAAREAQVEDYPQKGNREGFTARERHQWQRLAIRKGFKAKDIAKWSDVQLRDHVIHGKGSYWDALRNLPMSAAGMLVAAPAGGLMLADAATQSLLQGSPAPLQEFGQGTADYIENALPFVGHPGAAFQKDPIGTGLILAAAAHGAVRAPTIPLRTGRARAAAARLPMDSAARRIVESVNPLTAHRVAFNERATKTRNTAEGEPTLARPYPIELGPIATNLLHRGGQRLRQNYLQSDLPGAHALYRQMGRRQAGALGAAGPRVARLEEDAVIGPLRRKIQKMPVVRQFRIWTDLANDPAHLNAGNAPAYTPEIVAEAHRKLSDDAAEQIPEARDAVHEAAAVLAEARTRGNAAEIETAVNAKNAAQRKLSGLDAAYKGNAQQAELYEKAAKTPPIRGAELEEYRALAQDAISHIEGIVAEAGVPLERLHWRRSLEPRTLHPDVAGVVEPIVTKRRAERAAKLGTARRRERRAGKLHAADYAAAYRQALHERSLRAHEATVAADELHQRVVARETEQGMAAQREAQTKAGALKARAKIDVHPDIIELPVRPTPKERAVKSNRVMAARAHNQSLLGEYVLLPNGQVGKVIQVDSPLGQKRGVAHGDGIVAWRDSDGFITETKARIYGKGKDGQPSITRMRNSLKAKSGDYAGRPGKPKDEQGKPIKSQPVTVHGSLFDDQSAHAYDVAPNVVVYKTYSGDPRHQAQQKWTIGIRGGGIVVQLKDPARSGISDRYKDYHARFIGFDTAQEAADFARTHLGDIDIANHSAADINARLTDALEQRHQDYVERPEEMFTGTLAPHEPVEYGPTMRDVRNQLEVAARIKREPISIELTPSQREQALRDEAAKYRAETQPEFRKRIQAEVAQAQTRKMTELGIDPVMYLPHLRVRDNSTVVRQGGMGGMPHEDLPSAIGPGRLRLNRAKLLTRGQVDPRMDRVLREISRPIAARWIINYAKVLFKSYGTEIDNLDSLSPKFIDDHYFVDRAKLGGLVNDFKSQNEMTKILDAIHTKREKELDPEYRRFDGLVGILEHKDIDPKGNYIAIPKDIVDSYRKNLAKPKSGLDAFSQLTDIFRYTQLKMRPGYHAANAATSAMFGAQAGLTPADIRRAIRTPDFDESGRHLYPAMVANTISKAGGSRIHGGPLDIIGRNRATGQARKPFRAVDRYTEAMASTANSFEVLMNKAIYLKAAHKSYKKEAFVRGLAKTQTGFEDYLARTVQGENIRPQDLRFLMDMAGDFTKARDERIALAIPFYRWYSSMIRMTFWSLPVKHPGRAAILALLADQGREHAEQAGISLYDDLVSALPLAGDWFLDLANVSPYAVAFALAQDQNPLATAGQIANPLLTAPAGALLGINLRDWRPYENEQGQHVTKILNFDSNYNKATQHYARDVGLITLNNLVRAFLPGNQQLFPQNRLADTANPLFGFTPPRAYSTPEGLRRPSMPAWRYPLAWLGINLRQAQLEGDPYRSAFLSSLQRAKGDVPAGSPEEYLIQQALSTRSDLNQRAMTPAERVQARREKREKAIQKRRNRAQVGG